MDKMRNTNLPTKALLFVIAMALWGLLLRPEYSTVLLDDTVIKEATTMLREMIIRDSQAQGLWDRRAEQALKAEILEQVQQIAQATNTDPVSVFLRKGIDPTDYGFDEEESRKVIKKEATKEGVDPETWLIKQGLQPTVAGFGGAREKRAKEEKEQEKAKEKAIE